MMSDTLVQSVETMPASTTAAHKKARKSFSRETRHFGIQRKIVSHMTTESWKTIPHVTYMYEPDVTEFFQEFKRLNTDSQHRDKITFNTLMLKVIVEGMKASPELNAHIEFNDKTVRGKVHILKNIDISMPWLLPSGEMMTIGLRNMEEKSLDEMTAYIAEMGRRISNTKLDEAMFDVAFDQTIEQLKHFHFINVMQRLIGAKTGKHRVKTLTGSAKKAYERIPEKDRLTKADLVPGTVTISNIGSLYRGQRGAVGLLEIIPPQVFAVGVGAVQEKPGVYVDEHGEKKVGVRKVLPLCLAFDHRGLDFDALVPFMQRLDEIFENPTCIHTW